AAAAPGWRATKCPHTRAPREWRRRRESEEDWACGSRLRFERRQGIRWTSRRRLASQCPRRIWRGFGGCSPSYWAGIAPRRVSCRFRRYRGDCREPMNRAAEKVPQPRDADAIRARLGTRAIALVGMPGSGKSSIGRRLAPRLGLPFIDADTTIEQAA